MSGTQKWQVSNANKSDTLKREVVEMLTAKQLKFCSEYLTDLNATQAAIRAGYTPKNANRIAHRLMTKVDIQNKINELKREQEQRTKITQDRVLQELAAIGFASLNKIKAGDKLKALEMLAKHLGLFDKIPTDDLRGGVIIIDDIPATDDEAESEALKINIP